MAKLVLTDLSNLQNEATVVAALAANNAATEAALELTLSRDGTSPNTMAASLDMNSNRILNLPEPASNAEPARKIDLDDLADELSLTALQDYVDDAAASAVSAQDGAVAALAAYDQFDDRYLGSKAADPTVDNDNDPLLTGAFYWNTGSAALKVYNGATWNSVFTSGDMLKSDNLSGLADAATSRTNIGLGTADSPQFTAVNVGNATDTTITRASAGVIAVEGVNVALNSTTSTHTAQIIELGAASDTTISRASAGVIAVEGVNLTPNIPITSKSTAYTVVLGDANTAIYHPSTDNNARTFTIDSNANVAYPVGTTLVFINEINTVTISITTDTLTWSPNNTTGSRTLAAGGMATAIKVASTKWVISGGGLT